MRTHPFVIVDAAMNDLAQPVLYDALRRFEAVADRDLPEEFAA